MRDRPLMLENAPLRYAPGNELGVVFLFAHVANKYQLRIEQIKPSFPDCIAYRRVGSTEKRIRIEFEFHSSNFRAHNHNARKCDCIVCWHHDWPDVPRHLEVIELKKCFGWAFQVWIQPVIKEQCACLDSSRQLNWALSKNTTPGDLLLMYRCSPWKHITDVFVLVDRLRRKKATWRKGDCFSGNIRRICKLDSPVSLCDIRKHDFLHNATFIRRNMQGNHLATEYWYYLHEMIIERNPKLKKALSAFAPENM